jgi:hypothetical protein
MPVRLPSPVSVGVVLAVAVAVVVVLAPRPARPLPTRPGQPSSETVPPAPPRGTLPPLPPVRVSPAVPPAAASVSDPRRQRGMSLGLFAEDISFDYGPLLKEIAALGATHVQLVVPIYQEHGASTELGLHTRLSPSLSATAEAIRAARRVGLDVLLFPIVRLASPRRPGEWRGTLRPANRDAWFRSYSEILGDLAALGTMTGVSRLAIGSELSSLDDDLPRWKSLLERIRAIFPGTLVYSANWDHYQDAKLLDLVDEAGVVAYFELRRKGGPGDVPALERRWRELRADIEKWRAGRTQPFIFTEVGYRSRKDATATPWDENQGGEPDLEEQRRGFEAFRRAWTERTSDTTGKAAPSGFAGFYIWNWYGYGGPGTTSYTPRGKPAESEIRKLLEAL